MFCFLTHVLIFEQDATTKLEVRQVLGITSPIAPTGLFWAFSLHIRPLIKKTSHSMLQPRKCSWIKTKTIVSKHLEFFKKIRNSVEFFSLDYLLKFNLMNSSFRSVKKISSQRKQEKYLKQLHYWLFIYCTL